MRISNFPTSALFPYIPSSSLHYPTHAHTQHRHLRSSFREGAPATGRHLADIPCSRLDLSFSYWPSGRLIFSDPSLPIWCPQYIIVALSLAMKNLPFLDSAFLAFPQQLYLPPHHQPRQLPPLPSSQDSVVTESLSAGAQQGTVDWGLLHGVSLLPVTFLLAPLALDLVCVGAKFLVCGGHSISLNYITWIVAL